MRRKKEAPASVTLLKSGDAALGLGLMAFSMFLSIKLMTNTLISGIEGSQVFLFGIFGALLGFGIDAAKCIALVYSVFYSGWKRVAFIVVFGAAMFVSLIASYSELGRESYVTTIKSAEYTSLGKAIERSEADADRYRQEIGDTRYWSRKDMYQAKVDSIGLVVSRLQAEQKGLIQEGAGETSFFNKSIRAVCNWIGIKISFRGANLIFGFIIEIIASIFLIHWAVENMDRTLNWRHMLQELVSSRDSRIFIDRRLAAKQDLVASMRQAQNDPTNAIDIDFEMENLDLRIATKVAGLLQRGQNLPPTLQKKLDAIPRQEIPDPEAEKLLAELDEMSRSKQIPAKQTETKNENMLDSFDSPPNSFDETKQISGETNTPKVSISGPEIGFKLPGEDINEFLTRIRNKAISSKKLKAKERYAIAKTLKNNGLSNAEIGRELGMTGQGVGQLIKRFSNI